MHRMRLLFALLWLAGAGGGIAVAEEMPLPRPRPPVWVEPQSFREAAGAFFKSDDVTSAPSACRQRLEKIAALKAMPRLIGPGSCGAEDMVQLEHVLLAGGKRVDIKSSPMLRCEMAEQFALWVRDDVVTRVAKAGAVLTQLETYDDYNCRSRNRIFGAKVSEHGKGNAVDIRSMTFADKKVALFTDKTYA